ncbi:MAG: hypothetical protein QXZ20_03220 [Candidatus Aenigmatarchaeota archaeon]
MRDKNNQKGISLPVNFIVILAIAIIVLLIAVTLIFPWIRGPGATIVDSQAWSRGCMMWQQRGCRIGDMSNIVIENYDPDGDGRFNTLADACRRYLRYTDEEQCRRVCCAIPEERREEGEQG